MKGLKRRSSSGLNSNSYRVPTKQRGIDDSDTDDTISVASEDSEHRRPRARRMVTRKSSSGNEKPSMPNKQSTMGGVVTAFLGLRSRSIVREIIEEEPPPPPRKLLSAKRRLAKKSSSAGDIYPSAKVSLQRKFSESRAATALY